jgi:hypothetical protein
MNSACLTIRKGKETMLESERKIHNQGKLVELHPVSASACLLSCSSRVQNSFRREDGVYFFLTDKVILSTFANGIGEANIFNSFGYNRGKYFLPFFEEPSRPDINVRAIHPKPSQDG